MQLIEDASEQKLRGAYYTPPAIASFILHWGINGSIDADGEGADGFPSCYCGGV